MYENFILREFENGKIQGYSWSVENPDKVVCIIHGIGEYGGRFDRVAERFREENMAVLSMDLRGHGHSIEKKGHCAPRDAVLEDVDYLLKYEGKLYGEKQVILYGHSMGGNIALHYRAQGRFNNIPKGYIISAPWIRLVRPIPKALYILVKRLAGIAPSFTISSNVDEADLGNPKSVKPYHDDPMVHNAISLRCAVDGFEIGLGLENGSLEDNMKAAGTPTLIMHGGEDRICSVEGSRKIAGRLAERGDNVKYIEWEGLFHEIHNGGGASNGDEVIEEMVKWMKSLPQ